MTILKLANAGDEATLDITGCEVVEGQYGEQVKFSSGDDILFLPKASADRQIDRLELVTPWNGDASDYEQVIGERLTFSRTPSTKPGAKPFWNINLAKPNGKPPVAAPAFTRTGSVQPHPTGAPPKSPPFSHANKPEAELPPFLRDAASEDAAELAGKLAPGLLDKLQTDLAIYTALTEFVTRDIAPIYVKAGIGMSPESAAAATATLYIQAKR